MDAFLITGQGLRESRSQIWFEKPRRCAFLMICSDSNKVKLNDWLSNHVFRELKGQIHLPPTLHRDNLVLVPFWILRGMNLTGSLPYPINLFIQYFYQLSEFINQDKQNEQNKQLSGKYIQRIQNTNKLTFSPERKRGSFFLLVLPILRMLVPYWFLRGMNHYWFLTLPHQIINSICESLQ